jgi:hypothetical protein
MLRPKSRYALCLHADDFDDLEAFKVYAVLPDAEAGQDDMLRVVDESGEDYLYPARCFVFIELPKAAERALSNHGRS